MRGKRKKASSYDGDLSKARLPGKKKNLQTVFVSNDDGRSKNREDFYDYTENFSYLTGEKIEFNLRKILAFLHTTMVSEPEHETIINIPCDQTSNTGIKKPNMEPPISCMCRDGDIIFFALDRTVLYCKLETVGVEKEEVSGGGDGNEETESEAAPENGEVKQLRLVTSFTFPVQEKEDFGEKLKSQLTFQKPIHRIKQLQVERGRRKLLVLYSRNLFVMNYSGDDVEMRKGFYKSCKLVGKLEKRYVKSKKVVELRAEEERRKRYEEFGKKINRNEKLRISRVAVNKIDERQVCILLHKKKDMFLMKIDGDDNAVGLVKIDVSALPGRVYYIEFVGKYILLSMKNQYLILNTRGKTIYNSLNPNHFLRGMNKNKILDRVMGDVVDETDDDIPEDEQWERWPRFYEREGQRKDEFKHMIKVIGSDMSIYGFQNDVEKTPPNLSASPIAMGFLYPFVCMLGKRGVGKRGEFQCYSIYQESIVLREIVDNPLCMEVSDRHVYFLTAKAGRKNFSYTFHILKPISLMRQKIALVTEHEDNKTIDEKMWEKAVELHNYEYNKRSQAVRMDFLNEMEMAEARCKEEIAKFENNSNFDRLLEIERNKKMMLEELELKRNSVLEDLQKRKVIEQNRLHLYIAVFYFLRGQYRMGFEHFHSSTVDSRVFIKLHDIVIVHGDLELSFEKEFSTIFSCFFERSRDRYIFAKLKKAITKMMEQRDKLEFQYEFLIFLDKCKNSIERNLDVKEEKKLLLFEYLVNSMKNEDKGNDNWFSMMKHEWRGRNEINQILLNAKGNKDKKVLKQFITTGHMLDRATEALKAGESITNEVISKIVKDEMTIINNLIVIFSQKVLKREKNEERYNQVKKILENLIKETPADLIGKTVEEHFRREWWIRSKLLWKKVSKKKKLRQELFEKVHREILDLTRRRIENEVKFGMEEDLDEILDYVIEMFSSTTRKEFEDNKRIFSAILNLLCPKTTSKKQNDDSMDVLCFANKVVSQRKMILRLKVLFFNFLKKNKEDEIITPELCHKFLNENRDLNGEFYLFNYNECLEIEYFELIVNHLQKKRKDSARFFDKKFPNVGECIYHLSTLYISLLNKCVASSLSEGFFFEKRKRFHTLLNLPLYVISIDESRRKDLCSKMLSECLFDLKLDILATVPSQMNEAVVMKISHQDFFTSTQTQIDVPFREGVEFCRSLFERRFPNPDERPPINPFYVTFLTEFLKKDLPEVKTVLHLVSEFISNNLVDLDLIIGDLSKGEWPLSLLDRAISKSYRTIQEKNVKFCMRKRALDLLFKKKKRDSLLLQSKYVIIDKYTKCHCCGNSITLQDEIVAYPNEMEEIDLKRIVHLRCVKEEFGKEFEMNLDPVSKRDLGLYPAQIPEKPKWKKTQ